MSAPEPRVVETALPLHVEEYADLSEGDEHHAFLLVHGFGGSTFTWRYSARRRSRSMPRTSPQNRLACSKSF
jgi:hypothetical protein